MSVLHDEFKEEIKNITQLSAQVNEDHEQKILAMMKDHVDEIIELYNKNNEHYRIETADLIVLCFELLLLKNEDIDKLFKICLPRFYRKINNLINKREKKIKKKLD